MEKLYEKYGDQVEFYLVYVTEAHPQDYLPELNKFEGRAERADMLCTECNLSIPTLVDDAQNSVAEAYHVFNERAVLIDKGKIAFANQSESNPAWPDSQMVRKLEKAIVNLLGNENQQAATDQPTDGQLNAT